MKKVLIYSLVAVGILIAGVASVQAENDGNYPSIIQKLAERFNLNADEVREVIDENREEMYQRKENSFEDRLDRMEFSEEQKGAISAKRSEMWSKYGELKNLSPEERCSGMKEMKEEMKTWAEENDVNFGILNGFNKGYGKGVGLKAFNKGL